MKYGGVKLIKKIKLPEDFSIFQSNNKNNSPYFVFYKWILDNAGKLYSSFLQEGDILPIAVTKVYLTKEADEKLDEVVRNWIRDKHKIRSKAMVENHLLMLNMEVGPNIFHKDTKPFKGIKSDYVYLEEGYIINPKKYRS